MEGPAEINKNGFAILAPCVPDDRIRRVLEQTARRSQDRNRAGVRHAMRFEAVRAIAEYQPLRQLVGEVLGPRAFAFRATLFDKSQRANWLVVWHQDTALPLRQKIEQPGWGPWSTKEGIRYAHAPAEVLSQVLALRIHLDDSSVENGPLRVLPQTHVLGVLSDDRVHELGEKIEAVDCVAPRGGGVAMRPLLIHASSKSQSEMPRRVLHIEYAASASVADPLQLEIA